MAAVTLNVTRWGDPDASQRVLLVHGLTSTGMTWWRVASQLAEHDVAVVAPDLRGHGLSPRATTFGFADHAADLALLGGRWDVAVGHSLGGPIVLSAALEDAKFAVALVLEDPALDLSEEWFDSGLDEYIDGLDRLDPADIAADNPTWHAQDAHIKSIGLRAVSPWTARRCLEDNQPYHHLGRLEKVDIPTKVIGADPEVGALFTPEHGAAAMTANSNVTYQLAKGSGHSIHREDPHEVVEAVLAAL